MRLRDAIILVGNEYDAEARRLKKDPILQSKAEKILDHEYAEIEASKAVEDIMQGRIVMPAEVQEWIEHSLVMALRLGMRVQRKLDHPDIKTSIFDQENAAVATKH